MKSLPALKAPLIMGIVNVTPDSFSGDGVMQAADFVQAAVNQARQMLADGADIIDIGGESSKPGAEPISTEEEMARVIPVIEALKKVVPPPLISIDTVKPIVAEAAVKAGATIVNDVSMLHDPAMMGVIERHGCVVVLMHNRAHLDKISEDAKLGDSYEAPEYENVVEDVRNELGNAATSAYHAGIATDKIILDPGIGFGKTVEQNLVLIKNIRRIKELGFPVLVGASRKSFIGKVLDQPVNDRLEGTAATTAIAAFMGADIIRVHDVKFMKKAAKMAAAIRDS